MFSGSKSLILYFGLATAIANLVLVSAPLLSAGLVTSYSFSESNANFIIGSELMASAIAAIPAFYWIGKFNWLRIARFSTLALTVSNLCSIFIDDFYWLLNARIMAGVFSGTLLALYMVLLVSLPRTDQVFSGKLAVQLIVGALCITTISYLIEIFGMQSVYCLFTFLTILLLFTPNWEHGLNKFREGDNQKQSIKGASSQSALVLITLFIFGMGINSVWTDLARTGALATLELRYIGWILSFSTLLAIISGFLCSMIGLTFGRELPIRIGIGVGITGCALLLHSSTVVYFSIGASLVCISRVITIPYLIGKVSILNRTGRLAIATHIALAAGMGSGSYLVSIFSAPESNRIILAIGLVFLIVTLSLTINANFRLKSKDH
jgi:hypothetical protein